VVADSILVLSGAGAGNATRLDFDGECFVATATYKEAAE
jgi:hypothetical protein